MVQYSFTSTETRRLVRTDSPGWPPRLSHSSWTMRLEQQQKQLKYSCTMSCPCPPAHVQPILFTLCSSSVCGFHALCVCVCASVRECMHASMCACMCLQCSLTIWLRAEVHHWSCTQTRWCRPPWRPGLADPPALWAPLPLKAQHSIVTSVSVTSHSLTENIARHSQVSLCNKSDDCDDRERGERREREWERLTEREGKEEETERQAEGKFDGGSEEGWERLRKYEREMRKIERMWGLRRRKR